MIRKQRYLVLVVISVIIMAMLAGWWLGTGQDISGQASKLIAIGRLAGIIAAASVLLELLVMSRAPFIERNFDLEEINEFHRYNGFTMIFALVAHMMFLVAGYGVLSNIGWWPQLLQLNSGFEDVFKATIGTVAFFIAALSSVRVARKRLPYEVWYFVHIIVYGGVLLTFGHQIHSGGDIITQQWMMVLWYAVYATVFGLLLYYRFARKLLYALRYDFKVTRVELESPYIYSIYITGRNVRSFSYLPGAYAQLRFLTKDMILDSHPFSFSSSPGDDMLRVTIKASGDFTAQLMHVSPQTRVLIDGPRGSFTADRATTETILLVAGGIGIAPFIPLAKQFLAQGKRVRILYSLHDMQDTAFKTEFRELKATYANFALTIHDSLQQGRVNPALLSASINGDKRNITVYVCGPNAMTKAVRDMLLQLGVPKRNIIAERFTF